MKEKLVSIIIPTYKRPETLQRAIESVLIQNYENIEIIVVDDNNPGSQFRLSTEKIMKLFNNNTKVRYIKHEYNKNGSAARNTGFNNSNGEYIMFLDDDDEFLQNKISAQVKCLNNKDLSWGACYTSYIRKRKNKIVMSCAESREGFLLIEELKRNLFVHAGSNLMIRREVFIEMNGFDETFNRNQDIEFLVRILRVYKLAFVDVVGLIVHVHPRIMSQSFENLSNQYLEKFDYYIKELDVAQQQKIYRMINLQIFRSKITKPSLMLEGLKMVTNNNENKVLLLDAIKYLIHLLIRKIRKKSYGFKL